MHPEKQIYRFKRLFVKFDRKMYTFMPFIIHVTYYLHREQCIRNNNEKRKKKHVDSRYIDAL